MKGTSILGGKSKFKSKVNMGVWGVWEFGEFMSENDESEQANSGANFLRQELCSYVRLLSREFVSSSLLGPLGGPVEQ